MAKVASSVRITPIAYNLLTRLSNRLGRPKVRVIEEALESLEERVFWSEVKRAFAAGESKEMREERKLWDSTVNHGLRGDRW